jgi:protein-tyrosine-phosphatase
MMVKEQPEVLFVCVHNAGRSQMAAGLVKLRSDGRIHVRSAGSAPASEVNPAVVEAMIEIGVDMSEEFPKPLTDEVVRAADVVITMGCGDACPIYPGKKYADWQLDDGIVLARFVRARRTDHRGHAPSQPRGADCRQPVGDTARTER